MKFITVESSSKKHVRLWNFSDSQAIPVKPL